jgi:uncharacterized protein (DUF1778 family)
MPRTALLIRCQPGEADRIRVEARRERRTISSYVLNIVVKAVAADDRLFQDDHYRANASLSRRSPIVLGQRTAILVRCDVIEAERIREAARRRQMRINAFILQALKNAWSHQASLHHSPIEAHSAIKPLLGD